MSYGLCTLIHVNLPQFLKDVLDRPAGARFHRCALQVNPWQYAVDYKGGPPQDLVDEHSFNEALLDAAEDTEISVLALADHNRISSGIALLKQAADRGIAVFPGFETNSSEGIHLSLLFEIGTDPEHIEACIARAKKLDGALTSPGELPFAQLIAHATNEWGALPIAPHINGSNGLWKELSGEARAVAWTTADLSAVGLSKDPSNIPDGLRDAIANTAGEYHRDHPLAVLHAADVDAPADLSGDAVWTAISMVEPSLNGLRQAFLDPQSRVRRPDEVSEVKRSQIIAVGWEGGFFDGVAIPFAADFTTLIGGRGAGKSTVLHSLTFALGHPSPTVESAETQKEVVEKVLGTGTTIWVVVRPADSHLSSCVVSRTVGDVARVTTLGGEPAGFSPSGLLGGLDAYGQRDIARLAESPAERRPLLNRFVGVEVDGPIRSIRDALSKNHDDLDEAETRRDGLAEDVERLAQLRDRLTRYEDLNVEQKSRTEAAHARVEQRLSQTDAVFSEVGDAVEELRGTAPFDLSFLSHEEDAVGATALTAASKVLLNLQEDISRLTAEMAAAILKAGAEIEAVIKLFEPERQAAKSEYSRMLRQLGNDGDADDAYVKLAAQIQQLDPVSKHHARSEKLVTSLLASRAALLADLKSALARRSAQLTLAAKKLSREAGSRAVRVSVSPGKSEDAIGTVLRDHVGGRWKEVLAQVDAAGMEPLELVAECRRGEESLSVRLADGPSNQVSQLCALDEPTLRAIEEVDPGIAIDVHLNVVNEAGPPRWRPIEELSTGQKATAILMLLLSDATAPLIVDQPEDDLDNAFVYEGVVPRVRRAKSKHQVIFATHNANLPVLGDAEQIVVLEADDEHGWVAEGGEGALEIPSVTAHVGRLLEGGREAFDKRRKRYGF